MLIPFDLHVDGELDGPQQTVDLVRMEIDEETISIDISFNGSFTGQLRCRAILIFDLGIAIEYVNVYFEPEYPEYVSVVLEEYEARLTSEDPIHEFTANISIDPGTTSALNPIVIMDGTARTNHGNDGGVETDSASVRILPYYSATIFFRVPTGTIDGGSSKNFILTLQNTGNAGGHYILTVTNAEFLASKGIEVTFPDSRVYVEENGEREVDVKVSVSGSARRGSYIVKIAVWSEKVGHASEQDNPASLTLNVEEGYSKILGLIKDPIYLWVGLGILLVLVVLAIWGTIKLREHLLWKRTLNNIRNAELEEDPQSAEEEETII